MLIKKGAEANIYVDTFSNLFYRYDDQKVIIKERITKTYRNKELDLKLRKSRTLKEAKLESGPLTEPPLARLIKRKKVNITEDGRYYIPCEDER